MVIRGEALMTYQEFLKINEETDGLYENPRNLATATVQMYDGNESAKRRIDFYAFKLVSPEPGSGEDPGLGTETGRFDFMEACGIRVVPHETVNMDNVLDKIEEWKKKLPENEFPTDGLVFSYDDQVYADSLGETQEYLGLGETMTRKLMRREAFGCRIGNRLYSNKNLLDKWLEKQCRRAP